MIDTMKITVTTPTVTPRIVNDERSLLLRNVSIAIRADSLTSSNLITLTGFQNLQEIVLLSSCLNYSALRASIGSSFAARHAGQSPLTIPTIDETPTPNTADATLTSNGKPINAEIT